MHFEVLVEDASGKILLEEIMKKIANLRTNSSEITYRIIAYKGLGKIPPNLRGKTDPSKRILLDQLPKLLRGYGKSLQHFSHAVIVVVDLDDRNCKKFKEEMTAVLDACDPKPNTLFRIAIEEIEAWLLGDNKAIKSAYPDAQDPILSTYKQDSICGTWEKLIESVYPKISNSPDRLKFPLIGQLKCKLAQKIAPHLDVQNNQSQSFQAFRDGIIRFAEQQANT